MSVYLLYGPPLVVVCLISDRHIYSGASSYQYTRRTCCLFATFNLIRRKIWKLDNTTLILGGRSGGNVPRNFWLRSFFWKLLKAPCKQSSMINNKSFIKNNFRPHCTPTDNVWINIANCFNDWLRFDCIWSVDKFIKSDLNSFLITTSRSLSLRFISRSLPASNEKKAKTNNKMKWNLIAQRGPLECSATAFSIDFDENVLRVWRCVASDIFACFAGGPPPALHPTWVKRFSIPKKIQFANVFWYGWIVFLAARGIIVTWWRFSEKFWLEFLNRFGNAFNCEPVERVCVSK